MHDEFGESFGADCPGDKWYDHCRNTYQGHPDYLAKCLKGACGKGHEVGYQAPWTILGKKARGLPVDAQAWKNAAGDVARTVAGQAGADVAVAVADKLIQLDLSSPEKVLAAVRQNWAAVVRTIKPLTDRLPVVRDKLGRSLRLGDALVAGGAGSLAAAKASIYWYANAVMTAPNTVAQVIGLTRGYDDSFGCDCEESYGVEPASTTAGVTAAGIIAAITALAPILQGLVDWGKAASSSGGGGGPATSSTGAGITDVGTGTPGTVDLSGSGGSGSSDDGGPAKLLVPGLIGLGLLLLLKS